MGSTPIVEIILLVVIVVQACVIWVLADKLEPIDEKHSAINEPAKETKPKSDRPRNQLRSALLRYEKDKNDIL